MRGTLAIATLVALSGCGLALGLDNFRPCDGGECTSDAIAGGDGGSDVDGSALVACTTSADCEGAPSAARVCSTGYCRNIVQLAPGNSTFSCVVLSDGTVRCWGDNNLGQLGAGDYKTHTAPTAVYDDAQKQTLLSDVAEVGMGWDFGCARTNGGKIYCWGSNQNGHLGLGLQAGTSDSVASPVALGQRVAKQLSVGQTDVCALMTDQSVFCWGDADLGQLTDSAPGDGGTVPPHDTPFQIAAPQDTIVVQTGERQTCVQTSSAKDSLTCWGDGWLAALDNGNPVETDQTQYPPHYPFEKNTFKVAGNLPIDSFRIGEEHICASVSGAMYCWGGDYFYMATGQGGNGAPQAARQLTPWLLASVPSPVSEIDPSWRASCAMAQGSAYCWGMTDHGEIGIGAWSKNLVGVKQVPLSATSNVLGVAMHVLTACAWMDDGHVYCWGQPGDLGSKLGDGFTSDRWAPDLQSPVRFP